MKLNIRIIVLLILFFLGASVIIYSNTLKLRENLIINSHIEYDSIFMEMSKSGFEYINLARFSLGNLTLENRGPFGLTYEIPNLHGCLNLDQGFQSKYVVKDLDIRFGNKYSSGNLKNYLSLSAQENSLTLHPKDKKTIPIYGIYTDHFQTREPKEYFTKENIKVLNIYDLREVLQLTKENPGLKIDCSLLSDSQDPIKKVFLI